MKDVEEKGKNSDGAEEGNGSNEASSDTCLLLLAVADAAAGWPVAATGALQGWCGNRELKFGRE